MKIRNTLSDRSKKSVHSLAAPTVCCIASKMPSRPPWIPARLKIVWKSWHGLSRLYCNKYHFSIETTKKTDGVYSYSDSSYVDFFKRSLGQRGRSSGAPTSLFLSFPKIKKGKHTFFRILCFQQKLRTSAIVYCGPPRRNRNTVAHHIVVLLFG